MLQSLALIFLSGILLGVICKKLHLPALVGMILAGILLSPHMLNLLDAKILSISAELRRIALVIILTRAGLALAFDDLKQVGRPAILLCFLPACFEILGCVLLAPLIFGISVLEAAIIGSVIAAVSPAVVVPRMLRLIETRYGVQAGIPQMIMAAASVDDVFAIVLFTAFTGLADGSAFSPLRLLDIPISILLGIGLGAGVGLLLHLLFSHTKLSLQLKVLVLLSVSFLLLCLEDWLTGMIPFASLLAVMTASAMLYRKNQAEAAALSQAFSALWSGAEILLFVLVGATVDLRFAIAAGLGALLLLVGSLLFRCLGVLCSVTHTPLKRKERLFCLFAYLPKATVQAAIGGIPLAMGLPCGQLVLTVAVLAILITAPIGAACIDISYPKLLSQDVDQ